MCFVFFPLPLHKATPPQNDIQDPILIYFLTQSANIQGPDITNNVFHEGAMFSLESESCAVFSLSCNSPTQFHWGTQTQPLNLTFNISASSETNTPSLGWLSLLSAPTELCVPLIIFLNTVPCYCMSQPLGPVCEDASTFAGPCYC